MVNCSYNYSDENNGGSFESDIGKTGRIVVMVILLLFIPLILFGNSLLLQVYRSMPKLKHPVNYLIVNLAIIDLFAGFIVIPYGLMAHNKVNGLSDKEYPCLLTFYFIKIHLSESGLSILIISIIRFISVVKPLEFRSLITLERTKVVIVFSWIYILVVYAAALFPSSKWIAGCDNECDEALVYKTPFFGVAVGHIFMITLLTAVFNIAYILKVKRNHNKPHNRQHNKTINERNFAEKSKMIAYVISVFWICRIPYLLFHIMTFVCDEEKCGEHYKNVLLYLKWVVILIFLSNSFINPITYAKCNETWNGYMKVLHNFSFKMRKNKPNSGQKKSQANGFETEAAQAESML